VLGAAAVLALVLSGCSGGASEVRAASSENQQRQACVDRWNWMNYEGHFSKLDVVPAKVDTHPCRIGVAYIPDRSYAYNRRGFLCTVNAFGAFRCPEHADWRAPRRAAFNARFFAHRNGVIRLDRPPGRRAAQVKPEWVRRYPVESAFVVPFDRNGHFRPGLTLTGRRHEAWTCGTFASIHQQTALYGCGAGLYCFAPSLPARDGQLLACPRDRGSRIFVRSRLRLLPEP